MRPVYGFSFYRIIRKLVRRVRRRGWAMVRSFVVQLVSVGLVVLGVLARAAESSDAAGHTGRPHRVEAMRQPAPELGPNEVTSFDRTPPLVVRAKL